jgi:GTPase SAR1 family protein
MQDNKFNVLILGNAAVGKTSLIKAYTQQAFDHSH